MSKVPNIQLPDTTLMPMIGFGTWQLSGFTGQKAIEAALKTGYRLVDTAELYGNEQLINKAMSVCGIDRKELFITTKIKPAENTHVAQSIQARLAQLQTNYIDLLLIHWPAGSPELNIKIWNEYILAKKAGYVRNIGVSNFSTSQIEELWEATSVLPVVNQIEVHPLHFQKNIIDYCHDKGIVIQAYSPFDKGELLQNTRLVHLADKYDVTAAQLINRWCVQHRLIPLPGSSRLDHIQQNFDIFDFIITDSDMARIDAM